MTDPSTRDEQPAGRLGAVRLIAPVGEGGMGEVWAGYHEPTRVHVVVKVPTRESLADPARRERFDLELRTLSRLSHPSVVETYGCGTVDARAEAATGGRLQAGSPYVVMERLAGGCLETRPGPGSWCELRGWMEALLEGLAYVHRRGVLHRDIKPANLMFPGPGDLRRGLKIIDFGLARLGDEDPGGKPYRAGTKWFAAPEQLHPDSGLPQGPWTDLFAVGCTAWWLATGALLKGDPTLSTVRPRLAVPPGFVDWIRRLTAPSPYDRLQSASSAAQALRALAAPAPPLPEPATAQAPGHSPSPMAATMSATGTTMSCPSGPLTATWTSPLSAIMTSIAARARAALRAGESARRALSESV